jgi:hypothetical protein
MPVPGGKPHKGSSAAANSTPASAGPPSWRDRRDCDIAPLRIPSAASDGPRSGRTAQQVFPARPHGPGPWREAGIRRDRSGRRGERLSGRSPSVQARHGLSVRYLVLRDQGATVFLSPMRVVRVVCGQGGAVRAPLARPSPGSALGRPPGTGAPAGAVSPAPIALPPSFGAYAELAADQAAS